MTIRDLDRLVSRTDMNPISKMALRSVRRAVITGRCGDPEVRSGSWSVVVDTSGGQPTRMTFSFKRDTDGS